jgi:hypothetical protein
MGFLSKAFKKVKKQIQPGQMPRRGGGFGNLGKAIRRLNDAMNKALLEIICMPLVRG